MVSIKSFKKASHNLIEWDKNHPKGTMIEGANAAKRFFKEFTEVDIRFATLPSMLTFMPETSVDRLQRYIDRKRAKESNKNFKI